LLDKNKVVYEDIDVAGNKAAREEMVSRTGQIGVPVIDIDGDISVGYNEGWIKQKLNLP
jgi:glutaredoxin 3